MPGSKVSRRMLILVGTLALAGVCFAFWNLSRRSPSGMDPIYRTGPEPETHMPYFAQRSPRCLNGFQVTPTSIAGYPWDGHGEPINTVFKLKCSCGHDHFQVLGHYVKNSSPGHEWTVFVGPIALKCDFCAKVTELIDTDSHGYDAELGLGSATLTGTGDRTPFVCEKCGPKDMKIIARFEYPPDLGEEGFARFRGREQDLFTWFTLLGRCTGCDRLLTVTEFECA